MKSEEAEFLHKISTPLSVIIFQLEAVIASSAKPEEKLRLVKALDQVKKIVTLLEDRRGKL